MAWVISANTMFGYGIIISDICVTSPTKATADIIQKVYPVCNNIGAGFAGNVFLGFKLIEDLNKFLFLKNRNKICDPLWVSENWYRRAKKIYLESNIHDSGVHILLNGVSPDIDVGIKGWAKVYTIILRSPNFLPEIYTDGFGIYSIGSGASIEKYKKELQNTFEELGSILPGEAGDPGGYGRMLITTLSQFLIKYPVEGISKHIHLLEIERGFIQLFKSDHIDYLKNNQKVEVFMPKVATNWNELLLLFKDQELIYSELTC
ncbi:MAG: hypothetical protein NTZ12_02745 [Candidatus Aminicenantes bacterium]|nr:hypothetical protein [Candidatus Aminicenantes bacterium]